MGYELLHFVCNDQANAFRLQLRVNRPEGFNRGVVDIVHCARVEAEPAQGWPLLCIVRLIGDSSECNFFGQRRRYFDGNNKAPL